jgi:hypothetical protein
MTALLQALRALDPHQFDLLIFHLTKERYPGCDIKHIDGSGGEPVSIEECKFAANSSGRFKIAITCGNGVRRTFLSFP